MCARLVQTPTASCWNCGLTRTTTEHGSWFTLSWMNKVLCQLIQEWDQCHLNVPFKAATQSLVQNKVVSFDLTGMMRRQRSIGGMPLFKLLTLPAGLESPSIWSVVPHRARLVVAHFAVDSPEDDRLAAEITSRRTQASAPKIYHLVAE